MESKTSIKFTAASDVVVTIITDTASKSIKINGTPYTTDANGVLTQAISKLFALAEAYPELKANENFLSLQNDLKETEDKR